MSASEFQSPELVRALRALPACAPTELRERVRALGDPETRRLQLPSVRGALYVAVPTCLLALVAAAVLHGVLSSRAGGSSSGALRAHPRAAVVSSGKADHAAAGGAATLAPVAPTDALPTPSRTRHQHYEANLRVRVSDLDTLGRRAAAAMRIATELGGYVASVEQTTTAGEPGEADLDLRVPVGHVQTAMIRLSALGTVLEQQVSIVDLEQTVQRQRDRIRVLRVRIARITAALEQSLPSDVRLRLQFQLDDARQALARVAGVQKKTLRAAALSRVSLVLTTQHAVAVTKHHRGRLGSAVAGAADFLVAAGAVALLVLIVISPLLVIALLWWAGLRAWRRREERRLLADT
jgi:Domain of unknown function (DUF4349)